MFAFLYQHIEFFLGILATTILAFLAPDISDYRAKRSRRAILKKLSVLETELQLYDIDFANLNTLVLRVVRLMTQCIVSAAFVTESLLAYIIVTVLQQTVCDLTAGKCEIDTTPIVLGNFSLAAILSSLNQHTLIASLRTTLAFIVISVYWFVGVSRIFHLQMQPEKFRTYVQGRITRLRSKLD